MNAGFRATQNNRAGILLMCATMIVFATQDTLSKYLAARYDVVTIVMLRFWFMAALALVLAARTDDGVKGTLRSAHPWLQALRGALLGLQVCIMLTAFVRLGLIETHAIFASTPLLIAALAALFLRERVGPRRWAAIAVGFLGVLIILKPGFGVFSANAWIAIIACFVFATYSLLTRLVARDDTPETSFLWTGLTATLVLTPVGLWRWDPMIGWDWAVMVVLCAMSGTGHLMLIRTYAMAEASTVQPFSYLQLVFATLLAVMLLGEALTLNVAIGACVVVLAGLYAISRATRTRQSKT